MTQASAFGFQVSSEIPLQFTRNGGGVESLEVTGAQGPHEDPAGPPIGEWELQGDVQSGAGTISAALFAENDQFLFRISDTGDFRIDPAKGLIEAPAGADPIVVEQRLWGVPATLCFMHRGDLSLHAAAVEINGQAAVLAAPGRHGKSTLALACHNRGHRILTEDVVCCRTGPTPQTLPGPALVRMRPDMYSGSPPEGTHVAHQRPGRVYLGLDDSRRGGSDPVPIGGIFFLRESSDEVWLQPASPHVALADLWALSFRLFNDAGRRWSFQRLTRLAGSVPMWDLHRPLLKTHLDRTVSTLEVEMGETV